MLELLGERYRRGGPLRRDPRRQRDRRSADDGADDGPLFSGIGQVRVGEPSNPARRVVFAVVFVCVGVFVWHRLFPPTRYTVVEVDMNAAPDLPGGERPAPARGDNGVFGAEEGPPSSATPPPGRALTPAAPRPLAVSPTMAGGVVPSGPYPSDPGVPLPARSSP